MSNDTVRKMIPAWKWNRFDENSEGPHSEVSTDHVLAFNSLQHIFIGQILRQLRSEKIRYEGLYFSLIRHRGASVGTYAGSCDLDRYGMLVKGQI